jgi:hypothetical protein
VNSPVDTVKAIVGLRPSFSSHVRFGERGAPVDFLRHKFRPKAGKMPAPQSAIAQRRDDLERFEFMMGAERGRLAVTLDMLTDALILIGQHGVYCASTRNPAKPALDLETVLAEIGGAKELIQSVMEQLRLKSEQAADR